ncbi:MAG: ATP-binding protein [Desulfobacterota bacterium]|nr:ATP-binding protein [Thermodesulfobacteriota bacterium]
MAVSSIKHPFLLSIFAIALLFAPFQAKFLDSILFDERSQSIERMALLFDKKVASLISGKNLKILKGEISEFENLTGLKVIIFDPSWNVIYTSYEGSKDLYEIASELKKGQSIKNGTLRIRINGKEELFFGKSIKRGNSVLGTIVFVDSIENSPYYVFLVYGYPSIILLAILVFILVFLRRVYQPFNIMRDGAKKIANHGLKDVAIFHEIKGKLPLEFEEMIKKLKNDLENISKRIKISEGVLLAISDPILVIDHQGKIEFFNDSFSALVDERLKQGMHYFEVIRDAAFHDLIKEHSLLIRSGRTQVKKELELKGRRFRITGSAINQNGERLYVFHDVTDIVEVERMKKDFIANLSHELRTPLSAIKGFVETLECEIPESAKTYMEIIKRNTERLIGIVNDLLVLSKLEEGKHLMQIEEVDLGEVFEPILKLFEQKIKEKSLDLIVDIEKGVKVEADKFQIEQIFVNLIDNAVKYTDRGYIKITIKREKDFAVITVEDSGIGIPEKDHKRIFERFYVVDRSRSKKFGGTGLGLSIVKHVVMLHNGTIELKSSPGEGSRFTVRLPLRFEQSLTEN